MNTKSQFVLPQQLECFRKMLEPSLLTSYLLHPFHRNLLLTDSKLAGRPYLPKYQQHPKDSDGNYMNLLVQINFSQGNFNFPFPKQGLLQVFLSKKLYEPTNQVFEQLFQQDFKVRFYPHLLPEHELVHNFSYLTLDSNENFPVKHELGLLFSESIEPVSATDYRHKKYLKYPLDHFGIIYEDDRTLEDIYFELFLGAEHKMGGYPYFIEKDSRENSPLLRKFDTLLLQIVTNDAQGIIYGDSGIIKLFINQQNLVNLDFSEVYFHAEQY